MNTRILPTGLALAVSLSLSLSLGACDRIVYSGPSAVTTSKPDLYKESFNQEIATGTLSRAQTEAIAQAYWSNGDGPLHLAVSFDPQSKTNTAKKAAEAATRMETALSHAGIRTVETGTVPVPGLGSASRTVISFLMLKARAPGDCHETLNMGFADINHNPDYKFGCTIETYTAKQIARPKDLQGNDNMDNASGRVNANMLDVYQQGKPNQDLKGPNASETGNGG